MYYSPDYQTLAASPQIAQISQNLLTTLSTSLPTLSLWILVSVFMSMTILRYTLLPCLTLHGLEQTIKTVDAMLQGHIGLGIIPFNDGGTRSNFCFAPGQRGLGLLDCSEYLLCSDQLAYLDVGDLERSRRCMDYEERLCRYLKVFIDRICMISSAYKEVDILRHEIKHSTILTSKRHNKLKLDVLLLGKQ
ncbi:hypothetical protein BDP27DRAFT_1322425 [Rhodocollybia butyracea]|uniref:Uncharacterized protein n=1 Tax=Rhodocollybia butyracea TaxID=206335 RepID=A0A9P5Q008_9AGAR|nr:hypothetical protein BDP27DRAFT_1322425 [Rhodocollybia butyracea]